MNVCITRILEGLIIVFSGWVLSGCSFQEINAKQMTSDAGFEKTGSKTVGENKSRDPIESSIVDDAGGVIMTLSEADAIYTQISRCWIVPCMIKGDKNFAVKLEITLRRDGTVINTKVVEPKPLSHPLFKVAAESAQRAVTSPKCNSFPLNPKNYPRWKKLRLNFNPKDMF